MLGRQTIFTALLADKAKIGNDVTDLHPECNPAKRRTGRAKYNMFKNARLPPTSPQVRTACVSGPRRPDSGLPELDLGRRRPDAGDKMLSKLSSGL